MDFLSWLQIVMVCALGAMSPGPSLAIVFRNTIKGGKKSGVFTAVGHGLGICIYAGLVVTGLSVALVTNPQLRVVIDYVGATLLLWLGLAFIGIKLPLFSGMAAKNVSKRMEHYSHEGFVSGLLVALLNPKIAVFFLAVFSPFLRSEADVIEKAILIVTAGGIDLVWYAVVALVFSGSIVNHGLERHAIKIEKTIGGVLIFLAIGLMDLSFGYE
ncbi:MAG: lysine transporter LysE [Magnetovibrio sp.]|nr:lysine transporter LysE [Magnetovibrio sp.]